MSEALELLLHHDFTPSHPAAAAITAISEIRIPVVAIQTMYVVRGARRISRSGLGHCHACLNVLTTNVFAVVNSVTAALNVARSAQADDLDTTHAPLMHFYPEVVAAG